MQRRESLVVGAGVAGLAAAVELAAQGREVTVLERAASPGGKMEGVRVSEHVLDGGPTVLTMRWVFDELFASAGETFADHVDLARAEILARHAWPDGAQLDLHAEVDASRAAIAAAFGAREAEGFGRFARDAAAIFETLDGVFLRANRPSLLDLITGVGLRGLPGLMRIRPFSTLWGAIGDYFEDPRLRQLFGRYATYVGSSPYRAPATLMLIAHVEQRGVWRVGGGMTALARALAALAEACGARFEYGAEVETVERDASGVAGVRCTDGRSFSARQVLVTGDVAAVASGEFGQDLGRVARVRRPGPPSLSAVTWNCVARTSGFPLVHHNVFFSSDYAAEFDAIFDRRRRPAEPTVYVCAQDRDAEDGAPPSGPERLLCLANAPASGATPADARERDEVDRWEAQVFARLEKMGLAIERHTGDTRRTTPVDWARRFPATGGALYGPATHGWRSSFTRAGAKTALPGLYLAGGSTHPGAGVPMAALSGRQAAAAMLADSSSTGRFVSAATSGGTSMGSATTDAKPSP
ncbi:MAG: 1-hydroxycarotenoid 3,4-desaturase CrtD [Myxococcota bacterium]